MDNLRLILSPLRYESGKAERMGIICCAAGKAAELQFKKAYGRSKFKAAELRVKPFGCSLLVSVVRADDLPQLLRRE